MRKELLQSGEIPIYNNGGEEEFVSVVFKDETFWLAQKAMGELFETSKQNVSLHLKNCRRKVLEGKGCIPHDEAVKKVGGIYEEFRKKQDAGYISEFDRRTAKYLKGEADG